jgi:DNA-binding FadR family transcriptional regulator
MGVLASRVGVGTFVRSDADANELLAYQPMDRMRAASGSPNLMADTDYRFHLAIIRACRNEVFELIYAPISKLVWEDFSDRMHLFDPAQTIQQHEAIFDAIRSHDAQAAQCAMKHHLEVGYKFYLPPESGENGS